MCAAGGVRQRGQAIKLQGVDDDGESCLVQNGQGDLSVFGWPPGPVTGHWYGLVLPWLCCPDA